MVSTICPPAEITTPDIRVPVSASVITPINDPVPAAGIVVGGKAVAVASGVLVGVGVDV